jgi:hypothetical protein
MVVSKRFFDKMLVMKPVPDLSRPLIIKVLGLLRGVFLKKLDLKKLKRPEVKNKLATEELYLFLFRASL